MKKIVAIIAVLTLACPFANFASAADFVCPKMPMYAVDATNWFHYATVCKSSSPTCLHQYTTGYIGLPQFGKNCDNPPYPPNSGGNCTALGGAPVGAFELYYTDPSGSPPAYDALDSIAEIKSFLKGNMPAGADPSEYDNMTFSRPLPSAYAKPIAIKLTRDVSGSMETFYAIVWRVRKTAGPVILPFQYVGIEISGTPDSSVGKPAVIGAVCNAVATIGGAPATPIPGLLRVQFAKGNSGNPLHDDFAIIRLYDSPNNRNANYTTCSP